MADLTASDVTLTKIVKHRVGMLREVIYQLAFGDAALTIPAAGIPLPALSYFGGLALVYWGEVVPVTMDGYVYKYDKTNHKLLVYQSAGLTPAGTVAAPVFTGSALAVHSHDLVFKANAAANAVTMAANSLRNASAGDLTVAGGGADGGIAEITAGTPAGTNSAPAFTGTAIAAGVLVHATAVAIAAKVVLLKLQGK